MISADVSRRKSCALLLVTCWLFLLYQSNVAYFGSAYENYVVAAHFRNNYVNLFNSQPGKYSNQSKNLRDSSDINLRLRYGLDVILRKKTTNVTEFTSGNVKAMNASLLRHNVSRYNSDGELKVTAVIYKSISVVGNATVKFEGNDFENFTTSSNKTTVHENHGLFNGIADVLKKPEFNLDERIDTISKDVLDTNKVIEILDAAVNTSLIQEEFSLPAYSHLNDKAALIDNNNPNQEEVEIADNTKVGENFTNAANNSIQSKSSIEIKNETDENKSQPKELSQTGINQDKEKLANDSSDNLQKNDNVSERTVNDERNSIKEAGAIKSDVNLDHKEHNLIANILHVSNQTSNVTPREEIKNVGKKLSYQAENTAMAEMKGNKTIHISLGVSRVDSYTQSIDRFIKDSNCSTRETGVEDILCLKRPQFSSDFLNPCWYQAGKIKCLPYFHIIGVCKTGTTDLFKRLSHHPQILKNRGLLGKETWYWTWRRYGHCNFYKSSTRQITFANFIDHFDARAIELVTRKMQNGTLYYPAVTGHGDPMDFWDHSSWKKIPQNNPSADVPEVNTPALIKHVNPNVKLILILRDPIERLFSNYLHGPFGSTAAEFHKDVLTSLSILDECTRNRTLKSCLYDEHIIRKLKVPISGSFYSVHIKEWLKVFPRKQIYITRTQDLAKNIADTLLGIFRFLQLDPLPTKDLYRVANMPHYYNTKARETAGNILAETRDILRHLLEPYNTELASILGDDKFNFNYVS